MVGLIRGLSSFNKHHYVQSLMLNSLRDKKIHRSSERVPNDKRGKISIEMPVTYNVRRAYSKRNIQNSLFRGLDI
jgi:hypothetical protein